jgi:nucleoside-diphosphate-sugar epimerase
VKTDGPVLVTGASGFIGSRLMPVLAVATVATGNPMLVFAALTLGLVLGLQRRASGGLLARC